MAETLSDFYRGDTKKYKVVLKDRNTDPISVDGGTLWLTFKSNQSNPDTAADIQVSALQTEADPGNPTGEMQIVLSSTDTDVQPGSYFYDFQFVNSGNEVTTLLSGRVKILQDTTLDVA